MTAIRSRRAAAISSARPVSWRPTSGKSRERNALRPLPGRVCSNRSRPPRTSCSQLMRKLLAQTFAHVSRPELILGDLKYRKNTVIDVI
jgi:hypothetical protein